MSVGRLYSQYLMLSFRLNMARRRLDYCLYHRRVQIALDPQDRPCLRAHLYAHRTGLVYWLSASACFPACQHRFRKTVIPPHQLKELSRFTFACLSLGVSALAFIEPPLGYPDFFQSALVCDSILLAVLNYLCDFFSCKHFFARRYLAWNKFAIRTSPVAYELLRWCTHPSIAFISLASALCTSFMSACVVAASFSSVCRLLPKASSGERSMWLTCFCPMLYSVQ